MKKKLLLIFSFTCIFLTHSFANEIYDAQIELSDSAYIALFTCDPGTQLYASFGHSAIGVFDPNINLNIIFNYGTFSFNTPNFYLKFASGKLNYKLSIETYESFIAEYEREGRMVLQEELNLTKQQKQQLFDALLNNYKPENREYLYDFFFDNCATRIIDMLENVLLEDIQYKSKAKVNTESTFRNMIDEY